jgi:hypothetical protein
MEGESTLTWRGFGLRWVAANTAGWSLGMGIAEWISDGFDAPDALRFALVGLVLGTMQWFVLSRHLQRSAWWIPASVVAWYLGLSAGDRFGFFTQPNPLWAGGVGGAVAGCLQYLILRGQSSRAVLWIPASLGGATVAWIAGTWAGQSVYDSVQGNNEYLWGYTAGGAVGGLVFGVLTAPVPLSMLRRSKLKTPS